MKIKLLLLSLLAFTLSAPDGRAATIFPLGSTWKYFVGTQEASAPTNAWRAIVFNDSTWSAGPGAIGYASATPGAFEQTIQTTLPTSTAANYVTAFFRRTFVVASAAEIQQLTLTLRIDDGYAAWLNGTLIGSANVTAGAFAFNQQALAAVAEDVELSLAPSPSLLVDGTNVLAIQVFQYLTTSSDLVMDAALSAALDEPPFVESSVPTAGAVVTDLTFINVTFNEAVTGVDAADLRINGSGAASLLPVNTREYQFNFSQPPTGVVAITWALGHGIADVDGAIQAFAGAGWNYTLDPNAIPAVAILSEFLTDNVAGIEDEDGSRRDWVEIYNPGPLDINLAGWFLSRDPANLSQWRFPAINLAANRYLLVFASGKNKIDPSGPYLHTGFELDSPGGYLALVNPATNPVSVFQVSYPGQLTDVAYGRDRVDPNLTGYFFTPTPGAQNSTNGPGFAQDPVFSLNSGLYTSNSLTLTVTAPAGAMIRYTFDGTEPTAASLGSASPLTVPFTTNMMIKARVYQVNQPTLWPSAIGSRTFVMLDASTANFSSDLPIFVISTHGRSVPLNLAPGALRQRGTFVSIDTFRGRASLQGPTDFQGLAGFEIVGQTSAGFPKQPWRIELNDDLGNDRPASLLGLPAEGDWQLRNPYSDKCLMNDFLAYELWEDLGRYSCRRRFVEVFVDTGGGKLSYPGDYYGVLVLFERIERSDDRVNIAELTRFHTNEPAISGGFIIKKDKDSTGDLSFSTTGGAGHSGHVLKFHEPKPRDVTTAQQNWIRNYVQLFENSMYAAGWTNATGTNHYSHYIDVDAFVDQHLHVEFTKQIDGYRLSSYYSKDRNGKLRPDPIWDWNLSFGNANYLNGGMTNIWYWNNTAAIHGGSDNMNSSSHIWLRRLVYGHANITTVAPDTDANGPGDPNFRQKITDRWGVLRTNVYNGDRVAFRIDQIASNLTESAARNFSKYVILNSYVWPNPEGGAWSVDYTKPTYGEIITEMKRWVRGRYGWMDSQFLKAPAFNQSGGMVATGAVVTITAPAGSIYYTVDGSDPRASGGGIAAAARLYTGGITINSNAGIVARAYSNPTTLWTPWSAPMSGAFVTATPRLVITEIMYHPTPPPGGTNVDEDFEYIEVKNAGTTPINVGGVRLGGGIDVQLASYVLAPGSYGVIVANTNAFRSRYGSIPVILGSYTARLQNSGERIVLNGPVSEPIHDFTFSDAWQEITDGLGFSLVPVNENAPLTNWPAPTSWRASAVVQGSPGTNDAAATTFPAVVINEALTHTDLPLIDAIELRNLTGAPADISHWYLSDDLATPQKFRFGPGTSIPPNDYLVVYETAFNTGSNAFSLSSVGDQVFLFSGDAGGNLTGYQYGFDFGPQFQGVTFGRYLTSQGEDHFVAQAGTNTLGSANSAPRVGPVVLSEIHYHPPDVVNSYGVWDDPDNEYIELRNISGAAVQLYHPTNASIVWKLRDAVDFSFPPGVTLSNGGYLLVVGIDPANAAALAAFKAANGVPDSVPIYGPWSGKLDNSGDSVELVRPDNAEVGVVPYVLADKVRYSHEVPWDPVADGFGLSLQRIVGSSYGNDATNWAASLKTPGYAFTSDGPVITAQPQDLTILATYTASFSITATGAPPITYQWYFNNNTPVSGGVNPTLMLPYVQPSQSGLYRCLVFSGGNATFSSNALLTVLPAASITQQPTNFFVRVPPDPLANPTNRAVFVIVATTTNPPLSYRWRVNGTNIPLDTPDMTGITSNFLTMTNLSFAHAGVYSCAVTDGAGAIFSGDAFLGVRPYLLRGTTNMVVAAGSDMSVYAEVQAYPPPFQFLWSRPGVFTNARPVQSTRTNFAVYNSTAVGFTNTTGSSTNLHQLRMIFTNLTTAASGVALINSAANVMVLADTDHDGIPDGVENSLGLNPASAADGAADLDMDGMSNYAEFVAGTDPASGASNLKLEVTITNGLPTLRFEAVSNRLYTIQFSGVLPAGGSWSRLADVLTRPTNRVEIITDPGWTTSRFYRAVTPRAP